MSKSQWGGGTILLTLTYQNIQIILSTKLKKNAHIFNAYYFPYDCIALRLRGESGGPGSRDRDSSGTSALQFRFVLSNESSAYPTVSLSSVRLVKFFSTPASTVRPTRLCDQCLWVSVHRYVSIWTYLILRLHTEFPSLSSCRWIA